MRQATVYEYDRQLRPGTIGVDFETGDKNEEFTRQYEIEEVRKMGQDIIDWIYAEGK